MTSALLFTLAYALFPLDHPLPLVFYATFVLGFGLRGKKAGWILFLLAGILLKGEKLILVPTDSFPVITGTLTAPWTRTEFGFRSLLSTAQHGTVPLYVNTLDDDAPAPGETVRARARLIRFDPPFHGLRDEAPFGLQVKSSSQLERLRPGLISSVLYAPLRLNEFLYRRVEPLLRTRPELGSTLRALFFARGEAEDEEVFERFKLGGILHILAISGLHVGLYLAYLLLLMRALRIPPRGMAWIAVVFLLGYASFCGFRAPVMRACLAGLLHYIGLLLHRPQDPLRTLAVSLPMNALLMPHYAFTPGFILTYLASFAMLLFARTRLPAGLRMVVATIPAQMLLLPFILYAFGIFTWGAVALNPLVIPLASLLLAFFPFLVLAPCPLYADIGEALSRWVTGLITVFDRTFWWGSHQPYPVGALVLTFYAFMFWYCLKSRRDPSRLWKGLSTGLAVFLAGYFLSTPAPRTRTVFLDVGQGSATLVEDAGDGVLIDTGKASWSGCLLPQLTLEGVTQIQALILTHPDLDHVKWGERLLEEYPVGCLMVPLVFEGDFDSVIRTARDQGVPVVFLERGQRFRLNTTTFDVLHPGRAPCPSSNSCSLVLLETMRGRRLLLTGDAESNADARLIPSISPPLHVLQAAHHGSRTGTSALLLRCARPRLAVVSVGRNNPYGHPHPEVLARLARARVQVWRTDLRGACALEWKDSPLLW